MSESLHVVEKLTDYKTRILHNIKKINKVLDGLDITNASCDDLEQLATYYDEIRIYSYRCVSKLDNLIDDNEDSSDCLDSISTLSISGLSDESSEIELSPINGD